MGLGEGVLARVFCKCCLALNLVSGVELGA